MLWGRSNKQKEWKCDACVQFKSRTALVIPQYRRNRRGIKCEMCPGLEVQSVVEFRSVGHDVCRIWCDSKIAPESCMRPVPESSNSIVLCAAKGCHVPSNVRHYCFLAASADRNTNTSETSHSLEESDKAVENDAFLCTQYRPAMIAIWTEATGPTSLAYSRTLPVL
jgi:hypothetical protein